MRRAGTHTGEVAESEDVISWIVVVGFAYAVAALADLSYSAPALA